MTANDPSGHSNFRMTITKAAYQSAGVLAFALMSGTGHSAPTLNEWVAENTVAGESTVCSREVDGELFFAARAHDGRVRLGTRLDMTGYTASHHFTIAWVMTDENGAPLMSRVRPTSIKQKYAKDDKKLYADMVDYQTLSRPNAKELKLEVRIGKCATWEPATRSCESGNKTYTVKVCDAKI